MEDWVEVRARDVDEAVEHALKELGGISRDAVEIEVIEEPRRRFLGVGGRDAVVRVKPLARRKPRRRRQKGGAKDSRVTSGGEKSRAAGGGARPGPGKGNGKKENKAGAKKETKAARSDTRGKSGSKEKAGPPRQPRTAEGEKVNVNDQAGVVSDFLEGLLDAFGIEGAVNVRVDEDVIYADVSGGQSEALVGQKGAILQAVLELARTVVQRKTQAGARLRLDIGGYVERRREALKIYAGRLAQKVAAEGGEIMLEAMNPADRKVVHDAVAEVEGVRSFSEGEEPDRSVVIAAE